MATDLFNTYFTNAKEQYIYSDMVCSGTGDGSAYFSFDGSGATISDGTSVLSSLDLADMKVPLVDWVNETKAMGPYSMLYIKGMPQGDVYMQRGFVAIPAAFMSADSSSYFLGASFHLSCCIDGSSLEADIDASGSYDGSVSVEAAIDASIKAAGIPAYCEFASDALVLKSSLEGFSFRASDVSIYTVPTATAEESPYEDASAVALTQALDYYVPSKKYKNGAFRGIVIRPVYPKYNDDAIYDSSRSLKLVHVKDFMTDYLALSDVSVYPNGLDGSATFADSSGSLYDDSSAFGQSLLSVDDAYYSGEEYARCGWMDASLYDMDILYDPENDISHPSGAYPSGTFSTHACHAPITNRIGLYGYADWAERNGLWMSIGDFYCAIGAADAVDSDARNYVEPVLLYNPNPFLVQVKYIAFM